MNSLGILETEFVLTAFVLQIVLMIHFALRKWRLNTAIRYGPLVYALSIPAMAVSTAMLVGGKGWSFWLAGFLYLIWAIFGYFVEYIKKIEWRNPIQWPIFSVYVFLYLTTIMFYWFPLALIWRPLWYVYAVLFITSTILNISSHTRRDLPIAEFLKGHRINL